MNRTDRILIIIIALALVAASYLASGRMAIERANRTVEVIVDADDVRTLATAAGLPMEEALAKLHDAGAGALAVHELTVGDLAKMGWVMVLSHDDKTTLVTPDADLRERLVSSLAARLLRVGIRVFSSPGSLTITTPADELADVPALLRPEDLAQAQRVGLRLVARLRNFPGALPQAVDTAVARAADAGATLVVFDKEEVLGSDGLLPHTAHALQQHGLLFGYVEMAAQRGDAALARRLDGRIIRVHSITEADMLTMTPAVAIPRYTRAVQERNIRAAYIRLLTRPQADPLGANVNYVRAVTEAIREKGFILDRPQPFTGPPDWPPAWARVLAALGVLAGAALTLRRFFPLSERMTWGLAGMGLALGGLLAVGRPTTVTPLAGMLAGVTFPTLAVFWAVQGVRSMGKQSARQDVFAISLWRTIGASAITFTGALLIAGLYSRPLFLSGIAPFPGVKLSLLIPLLAVVLAIILDLSLQPEALAAWWARVRTQGSQLLGQPVSIGMALMVMIVMGALAFALTRSGNQPVVAPSPIELKLRGLLEAALIIRPRTKEFLLGHPALMLAIALSLRGRRTWLPLVVAAAALGQVSLLNTYCHFHTPLAVSLIRSANGLWVGALIGLGALLVWQWRLQPRPPERP